MRVYKHPQPFADLRQLYWQLRNRRAYDIALRRKLYRLIKTESLRLVSEGFSAEHVRLYCRYLSNPVASSPALARLQSFEDMLVEFARIRRGSFASIDRCVCPSVIISSTDAAFS